MTNLFQSWILACRPKTLPAAIAPVLIGTAMAWGDGIQHFPTAVICLWGAIAIQIGTNLANDYFDFKKGTDTAERIGPVRVTQAGLIKPETVRAGFILAFGVAAICAELIYFRAGWPIAVIGVTSIICGILYTGGPKPLGYLGLGDLFVFIFFGPVAVGGTYYAQSFEINSAVMVAGIAPGLFSMGILAVNNYRDIDGDRKSGKKTLAVRFGREFAQIQYAASILFACFIPSLIYMMIEDHKAIVFSSLVSIVAIRGLKNVFSSVDGATLNETLAFTGKLLFLYSIAFSIGWML